MYEATGSTYRVFASHEGNLAAALTDAAGIVEGVRVLEPTAVIRVVHNINNDGDEIVVLVEVD